MSEYSDRDVAEFIIMEGDGLYKLGQFRELVGTVKKHREYGTLLVNGDEEGIFIVCRYNLLADSLVYVINIFKRKDKRSYYELLDLIRVGVKRNPNIRYISFDRGKKFPGRKRRVYKIADIIK